MSRKTYPETALLKQIKGVGKPTQYKRAPLLYWVESDAKVAGYLSD